MRRRRPALRVTSKVITTDFSMSHPSTEAHVKDGGNRLCKYSTMTTINTFNRRDV